MSNNQAAAGIREQGGRSVLGVHMAIDSLRAVEVERGSVVRWIDVPYPDGLAPGAKEFPAFLKKSLCDFHSAFRHPAVWVVGPLPSLQVRFLSLPKVRPRQLSNLVYWTFRKEIPFDPAQTIFDYDVEGDVAAAGAGKKTVEATAYTVSQEDVRAIEDTFAAAGLLVDGIAIPSFALRNLFGVRALAQPGSTLGLYVGGDASSLLLFKGRHVVAHRVFKTGMNVMLDVLRDRHPDWSAAATYRAIHKALAASGDAAAPADENAQIADTVRTAFDRLIQQVERSLSAYLAGKSEEEIRNAYVAGSMAGLPTLVKELDTKLGLANLPLDWKAAGLMESALPAPAGPEETGRMAIALGAALSTPAQTPNLLHTYVKRGQEARQAAWRKTAFALAAVGLVALMVAGGWVARHNRTLRAERDDLQSQIRQYAPYPDRAMIQALVDQATANHRELLAMVGHHLPVAALNQLALATPEEVRLTFVALKRDAKTKTGKKNKEAAADSRIRVEVGGMVLGPPGSQESQLAAYVLRLEDDDLFEQVALNRSEEGREGGAQVLLFDLETQMDDLAAAPATPETPKGAAP